MAEIGCPECGQQVRTTDASAAAPGMLQCPNCGTTFRAEHGVAADSETAVLQRARPQRGTMLDIALVGHLRISGSIGLEAPSALKEGKTVVGREDSDILVADEALSAQHFEVDNREGRFSIRDLSSTNGTRVNGELLNRTVELKSGDRIEAGHTTFVFRTLETIPWNAPS